jgi:hypothetical protein
MNSPFFISALMICSCNAKKILLIILDKGGKIELPLKFRTQ